MPPTTDSETDRSSRRRSRVRSDSHLSAESSPKRPRLEGPPQLHPPLTPLSQQLPPPQSAVAMSADAKGKSRLIVIDLADSRPVEPNYKPQTGARMVVIKNHGDVARPVRPDEYYRQALQDLGQAADSILAGRNPTRSYEALYRAALDVCRRGQQERLYGILNQKVTDWVCGPVRRAIRNCKAGAGPSIVDTDATLLKMLEAEWTRWDAQMNKIRRAFNYLDEAPLHHTPQFPRIKHMAVVKFRDMLEVPQLPTAGTGADAAVPADPPLASYIVNAIYRSIDLHRRGELAIDPAPSRECIRILKVLGIYNTRFENGFLRLSRRYFDSIGSCPSMIILKEYVAGCEDIFIKESNRCLELNLDTATKLQLIKDGRETLIRKNSAVLLDSDNIGSLLDENDTKSLHTLHELLHGSGLQLDLKEPWKAYISRTGAAIVGDTSRGDDMALRLLQLKHRLERIAREALASSADVFLAEIRLAFRTFMNSGGSFGGRRVSSSKVGEMVAKYMDKLLRGGLRSLPPDLLMADGHERGEEGGAESDVAEPSGRGRTRSCNETELDEITELERQLDNALELFRLIDGKDTFEAFYKRDLARRLLMNRSASLDAERSMLAKLRAVCGLNFTHNMEQMFRDQDLAKEEMAAYRDWSAKHPSPPDHAPASPASPASPAPPAPPAPPASGSGTLFSFQLDVKVLSAAAWPTYPDIKFALPAPIAIQLERFDTFYRWKHSGRVLDWKLGLGTCLIKAPFPACGSRDLCVSAQQAAVILLFDNGGPAGSGRADGTHFLTYGLISETTGLVGEELNRTLQSLACGRTRILVKHPRGRDIRPTDTFSWNIWFNDPRCRIKINQIQLRESAAENEATYERIAQDRRFETQAAVVRVMKMNKTMDHEKLVAEVMELTRTRGAVDAAAIKLEIENLIEKDYIEREGSSYAYMA